MCVCGVVLIVVCVCVCVLVVFVLVCLCVMCFVYGHCVYVVSLGVWVYGVVFDMCLCEVVLIVGFVCVCV